MTSIVNFAFGHKVTIMNEKELRQYRMQQLTITAKTAETTLG